MKKSIFIFLIILLTVISLFFAEYKKRFENKLAPELTIPEYNSLVKDLDIIVTTKGVNDAFQKLKDLISKRPEVLNACHSLGHNIGHSAYRLSSDINTLWSLNDPLCGYGYIHGVLEYYIGKAKNSLEVAISACDFWSADSGEFKNCIHGVGHAFMLALNHKNLDKALSLCEQFNTVNNNRRNCATGVFEEYFEPHNVGIPESKFSHNMESSSDKIESDSLFSTCKGQNGVFKQICYTFIPYLFSNRYPARYEDLLKWCEKAEEGYISYCFYGAGKLIAKQNLSMPDLTDKFCNKSPEKFRKSCKSGSETIINSLKKTTK